MKHFFLLIIVIVFLTSCNNNAADTTNSTSAVKDTSFSNKDTAVEVVKTGEGLSCFAYLNNRDTILMKLNLKDNVASGNLVYNIYGKDKNKGTFKGFLTNDTLLLNYNYASEGTRSVRQVAFLVKGDILVQGIGSMKDKNGSLVFSNPKSINYDNSVILESVDCDKLGPE